MNIDLSVRTQASLFQASKWLKSPVLLDIDEMEQLLKELGDFRFFLVSGVLPLEEGAISHEDFLSCYGAYVNALKHSRLPEDPRIRPYLSSVITADIDAVYSFPVSTHQHLIKIEKPVIQLQPHRFAYSTVDGKFRSMVAGIDSIWWGVLFTYPQIFQDADLIVHPVTREFANTIIFRKLQKWVRDHTIPTPFQVEDRLVNVPIRLGKKCLSWINRHPQLAAKGLSVGDVS